MPRKYTKRSDYWKKFRKNEQPIESLLSSEAENFNPELIGDSIYESVEASRLSEPKKELLREIIELLLTQLKTGSRILKMVFCHLSTRKTL